MSALPLVPIAAAAAALGACLGACSDDAACVAIDTACVPLYEPTFDNVFAITLRPSCGVAGSQCHAREGAQAGLVFDDIDEAYSLLTEQPGTGGEPRVDREA